MDISDRATEREEEHRADALADQQRRSGLGPDRESSEECRVCGEPIPEGRRKALPGVETCVDCQGEIERALFPLPQQQWPRR